MWNGRRLTCFELAATLVTALLAATAVKGLAQGGPLVQPVTGVHGPFTIHGLVLDPQGRPLAGYPVRLLPVLPEMGVDDENLVYRITGRNEHRTVTDAAGRFVMTGVVDYPQVKHHAYRVAGNWDLSQPYFDVRGRDVVALSQLDTNVIELTIPTERASRLTVRLHRRSGQPFNGTRALTVSFGGKRHLVVTARFIDGIAELNCPPGDAANSGRVALLDWATRREAKEQALARGHNLSVNEAVLYGIVAQKDVPLRAGQTAAVDFTLPE